MVMDKKEIEDRIDRFETFNQWEDDFAPTLSYAKALRFANEMYERLRPAQRTLTPEDYKGVRLMREAFAKLSS